MEFSRKLKRHRSLVAALVAGYAVWRYGRYLAWGWLQLRNLPFVDGPLDFLLGNWEAAAALGVAIFIAVFAGVRYALGRGPRTPAGGDDSPDSQGEPPPPLTAKG